MTRVAIAGLGKMGLMHAAVVSALPDAQIVAVADPQTQLAAHIRSLGLEAPFFPSLDALLAQTPVDAVMICTPASTHLAAAEACLARGVHVFIEKPLADTLAAAQRMVELAAAAPGVHAVGYMKAHLPLYQHLRGLVQGGALGTVHQVHASVYLSQVFRTPNGWVYDRARSGGGIVINSTCHLLHLLQWFFGDVRGVFARTRSIHSGVEDAATIILEHASGVVSSVDTSWSTQGYPVEHTEVHVIGDAGSLTMTDERARLHLTRAHSEYPQGWTAFHRSQFDRAPLDLSADYGGEGYANEDADFLAACAGAGTPLVTWQDGLRVQAIIDAIYRSADEGHVTL